MQNIITQEMKNIYADIKATKGVSAADARFAGTIARLETSAERGKAWDALREVASANQAAEQKAIKAAKRKSASVKRTIGKVAKELLASYGLTGKEYNFVTSIQHKRTLTEKQGKWLDDICRRNNIALAEYGNRKSAQTARDCQHEDLGSLGYVHGTTVKCPYCGQLAQVW